MTSTLASSVLFAVALFLPSTVAAAEPSHTVTTAAITAADLSARDKAISDDVFQGRGPGTAAGERAADWIAAEMQRIGLKPGNKGSYFQDVPAVSIALDPANSSLTIVGPDGAKPFKYADEAIWATPRYDGPDLAIDRAPLVFVGYQAGTADVSEVREVQNQTDRAIAQEFVAICVELGRCNVVQATAHLDYSRVPLLDHLCFYHFPNLQAVPGGTPSEAEHRPDSPIAQQAWATCRENKGRSLFPACCNLLCSLALPFLR